MRRCATSSASPTTTSRSRATTRIRRSRRRSRSRRRHGGIAMIVSLIAALDLDYAIGRDNALPWHLPADLRRFKALTLGKPMLMGRRTAQSLGRALPGRENLVLTRSGRAPFDGMVAVSSMEQALEHARGRQAGEL